MSITKILLTLIKRLISVLFFVPKATSGNGMLMFKSLNELKLARSIIEWYNMQKLKQCQYFYLLFIVDN